MSSERLPGEARSALQTALEAVGAYRAGYAAGEMPELDYDAALALAGIASVALDRLERAGGDAEGLLVQLYALANGIPVPSS